MKINLTDLGIDEGQYSIKVVAKAQGLEDSDFSNEEQFEIKNTYTVTITRIGTSTNYYRGWYSLDNGGTWTQITSSTTINDVNQIKFRINANSTGRTTYLYSTQLGFSINQKGTSYNYTDNFILTQNITDVVISQTAPS